MANYLVTWEIDIDEGGTPIEAARKAWKLRNNKGSIANVFTVHDKENDTKFKVDLLHRTTEEIVEEEYHM